MRTTRAWIDALEAAGVPCGPINRLDDVFADPQVRGARAAHRRCRTRSPARSRWSPTRSGCRASPVDYRRAPPTLGEHTGEVLGEWLGTTDSELGALRARGVV